MERSWEAGVRMGAGRGEGRTSLFSLMQLLFLLSTYYIYQSYGQNHVQSVSQSLLLI